MTGEKERCVCSCSCRERERGFWEAGVDIILQIATDGVFWAADVKPKESDPQRNLPHQQNMHFHADTDGGGEGAFSSVHVSTLINVKPSTGLFSAVYEFSAKPTHTTLGMHETSSTLLRIVLYWTDVFSINVVILKCQSK